MLNVITGFGLLVDILICTFFAWRLTYRYKKDPTNIFLKYFVGFFWAFDVFLLATIFYVPNLIVPAESALLHAIFAFAFFTLYLTAAFAARVVALVNFPEFDNRFVFWPIVIGGVFVTIYLLLTPGPFVYSVDQGLILKITAAQSHLMAFAIATAFFASSYTFAKQAIKDKNARFRSGLLSVAFILWIIGGASHGLAITYVYSIFSDALTSLGFIAAFIALIKSPKPD